MPITCMSTQQQLPISFQSNVSCHLPVSFFTRHPPNPNHQLSKTPTIPSHQVSSFQSQLELFPFLYPLTPNSVFLSHENSLAQVFLTLIPHPKTDLCHIQTCKVSYLVSHTNLTLHGRWIHFPLRENQPTEPNSLEQY